MLGKLTVGVVWSKLDNAENIYIGRSSKHLSPLGNPFVITGSCSREQAISKYEDYLMGKLNQGDKDILAEMNRIAGLLLKGKNVNLTCYCKHKDLSCHGDIIQAIISERLLEYQAEN